MRHDGAPRAPRESAAAHPATGRRWSTPHYLQAAALALVLTAPAPFFWNPPLWIMTLMARPGRR